MRSVTLPIQMKPTVPEAGVGGLPSAPPSVTAEVTAGITVKGASRGFTLIEVMIALTIGLIIILTVLGILASTSRGFKVNDDNAKLTDIATLAMRAITNDLSMAGYYGEQNSLTPTVKAYNNLAIDDCGTTELKGYAGALTFNFPVTGLDRFNGNSPNGSNARFCGAPTGATVDANSPIIQVKYAVPPAFDPSTWDATVHPLTGIYLQADPGGAVVFKGSDYTAMKDAGKSRRKPDGTEAPVYAYQTYTYFIASVPPAGGGDAVPTLFRRRLNNTVDPPAFISEAIAEGVERMAIKWGFTNNATPFANVFSYYPQNDTLVPKVDGAADPKAAVDWSKAVSAEVTLLVRIKAPDFKEDANTLFQVEAGNPFYASAAGLGFRRKILATTIQFRNRTQ